MSPSIQLMPITQITSHGQQDIESRLIEVAKRNLPILIAKSAPTDIRIRLTAQLGLILINSVRGK